MVTCNECIDILLITTILISLYRTLRPKQAFSPDNHSNLFCDSFLVFLSKKSPIITSNCSGEYFTYLEGFLPPSSIGLHGRRTISTEIKTNWKSKK